MCMFTGRFAPSSQAQASRFALAMFSGRYRSHFTRQALPTYGSIVLLRSRALISPFGVRASSVGRVWLAAGALRLRHALTHEMPPQQPRVPRRTRAPLRSARLYLPSAQGSGRGFYPLRFLPPWAHSQRLRHTDPTHDITQERSRFALCVRSSGA